MYLGLGKTLFNSSVSLIDNQGIDSLEHILTERITRKKANGAWPEQALEYFLQNDRCKNILSICENRDVKKPAEVELDYNKLFPFFEYLKKKNLHSYSSHFNGNIKYLTHHYCHALAATIMSPYEKCLILVMDGAGSNSKDFDDSSENSFVKMIDSHEESTVYSLDQGRLHCLEKNWQSFEQSEKYPEHFYSEGLGTAYEKVAEYVFKSKRASGKVMGLAPFGKRTPYSTSREFLNNLNWSNAFEGGSKSHWQNHDSMKIFEDLSASIQGYFEAHVMSYLKKLRVKYPTYNNIILMGGCALNCSTNILLYKSKTFDSIYVPPFPGDESIGIGCAAFGLLNSLNYKWSSLPFEKQHGYFGPINSAPESCLSLKEKFSEFNVKFEENIEKATAKIIADGQVVAWFQGRSESGPRSLGNRSILARADKKGLKDYLNENIKFREAFRPYGCSVPFEYGHVYFDVDEGFDNPYMSFATKVRPAFKELLQEVSHIDGTSRMQSVRVGQNERFYNLINEVGKLTGVFCLLNTSLNIMGEPIVETIDDAYNFLKNGKVNFLVVGNFIISK